MSNTRILIEDRLTERQDTNLETYVRELRQDGASWRLIATTVHADTEVDVTPETIRLWLGHLPGMERPKLYHQREGTA